MQLITCYLSNEYSVGDMSAALNELLNDDILSGIFIPYMCTVCMLLAGKSVTMRKNFHENSSQHPQCITLSNITLVHVAVIPTISHCPQSRSAPPHTEPSFYKNRAKEIGCSLMIRESIGDY